MTEIRIQWMQIMGCDEDEIVDSLTNDPPKDIADEQLQLGAAIRLQS